ncbi:MAG: hypothetical protein Rubg2KO_04960 [Rubricoccaceae bacterium]
MSRLLSLVLLASALAMPLRAQGSEAPDRASAEPLFISALAALYSGDPARAVTRLSDVLTIYPEDPVVLDAMAEAYLAQDLMPEALYHAELAASLAPDDAAIQRRYADVLDASGNAVRAQQARDTAQRLDPQTPQPRTTPPPPPPPARQPEAAESDLPGEAAYRAGRYAEAADALLSVVDENPRQMTAWALALDALARTSDSRAGDTAELALLLYPTVPSILVPAAEALQSAGRSSAAIDAASSALRGLDSGDDDPALRQRADAVLSSLQ